MSDKATSMTTSSSSESSMSTFALSKRPRTVRAKFPKVRTGCITCKKRHVKCDEAKPGCMRCLKWIGHCSGYSYDTGTSTPGDHSTSTSPKAASSQVEDRIPRSLPTRKTSMVASNSSSSSSCSSLSDTTSQGSGRASSLESVPIDPQLGIFGSELAGDTNFGSQFWNLIVPQLIQSHPGVRAANKAVHMLMLAKQPSLMLVDPGRGERNYSEAIKWYDFALHEVRSNIVGLCDVRSAILCSMFFVIFETIHGDRKSAAAHLFNGQRMMDEFVMRSSMSGIPVEHLSFKKELGRLSRFLGRQTVDSHEDPCDPMLQTLEWGSLGNYTV